MTGTAHQTILSSVLAVGMSALCWFFPETLVLQHLLMLSYIGVMMWKYEFAPTHPVVWLLPFIYIYHGSTSLYHILELETATYPSETTLCVWIAVLTIGTYFSVFSKGLKDRCQTYSFTAYTIPNRLVSVVYVLTLALLFLDMFQFLSSGAMSKIDAYIFGMEAIDLNFSHSLFIVSYTILLAYRLFIGKRIPYLLIGCTLCGTFMALLVLGERDLFLRPLAITLLLLSIRSRNLKWGVLAIGCASVFLVPVLGAVKSYFTLGYRPADGSSIFLSPFYGEFLRVGKNLEVIMDNVLSWDYYYGETLVWDLMRGFIPGFLYVPQNPTSWFNDTFFSTLRSRGGANGFSLMAEGYINGGHMGVMVWYLLLSIFAHVFHVVSRKSALCLAAYIYMIPFMIHVQRADFSNLISPFWKQMLLPVLLFVCLSKAHSLLVGPRRKGRTFTSKQQYSQNMSQLTP